MTKPKTSKYREKSTISRNGSGTVPKPLILPLPQINSIDTVYERSGNRLNQKKQKKEVTKTLEVDLLNSLEENSKENLLEESITEVENLIDNINSTIQQTYLQLEQNVMEREESSIDKAIDDFPSKESNEVQENFSETAEYYQKNRHQSVNAFSDEQEVMDQYVIEENSEEEFVNIPKEELSPNEIEEAIRKLSNTIQNISAWSSVEKEQKKHVHEEFMDDHVEVCDQIKETRTPSINQSKVRKNINKDKYWSIIRKPLKGFIKNHCVKSEKYNRCLNEIQEEPDNSKKFVPIFKFPTYLAEVSVEINVVDCLNSLPTQIEIVEMDWKIHSLKTHVLTPTDTIVVTGEFVVVVNYVTKSGGAIHAKQITFPWEKSEKVNWINKVEQPGREKKEYLFRHKETDDSIHHELKNTFAEPIQHELKETNVVWHNDHNDIEGSIQGVVKISLDLYQLQKIKFKYVHEKRDV